MFHVEFTRARDNVVLLTDDRAALIEALETVLGEQMSAAEGDRRAARGLDLDLRPTADRSTAPASREGSGSGRNHAGAPKGSGPLPGPVLSAVAASVRQRAELSHYAAADATRIT